MLSAKAFRSSYLILLLLLVSLATHAQNYTIEFYGTTINLSVDTSFSNISVKDSFSHQTVKEFAAQAEQSKVAPLIHTITDYKRRHQLNDWLFYQLVRQVAQLLSPKQDGYLRYTLFKWYLMCKSGYDAKLALGNEQVIFFIRNEEDVQDIPFFELGNQKYVCLNYHDYGKLFQKQDQYFEAKIKIPGATQSFSYHIDQLPEFKPDQYHEKNLTFNYKAKSYHFRVKVTDEIGNIFKNYPVVDFETYFNIPLSRGTYQSLIPILKQNISKLSTTKGVDYLMRFTRYAFAYQDDEQNFGKEKRFTPEQTLTNDGSDCDDRAALFFYLVKEIYNLPMIAVCYPTHITMAVQFDKPLGETITYNGKAYTVCEPTPQKEKLKLGQLANYLKNQKFEIVYAYQPK